jgi:hypothetical protein
MKIQKSSDASSTAALRLALTWFAIGSSRGDQSGGRLVNIAQGLPVIAECLRVLRTHFVALRGFRRRSFKLG